MKKIPNMSAKTTGSGCPLVIVDPRLLVSAAGMNGSERMQAARDALGVAGKFCTVALTPDLRMDTVRLATRPDNCPAANVFNHLDRVGAYIRRAEVLAVPCNARKGLFGHLLDAATASRAAYLVTEDSRLLGAGCVGATPIGNPKQFLERVARGALVPPAASSARRGAVPA